jgi:hypothetical protein
MSIRETFFESGEGHVIILGTMDSKVHVGWVGPPRMTLTAQRASELGYLIRGYARLAEPDIGTDQPHGSQ